MGQEKSGGAVPGISKEGGLKARAGKINGQTLAKGSVHLLYIRKYLFRWDDHYHNKIDQYARYAARDQREQERESEPE